MTSLKVEETGLQTRLAELSSNEQIYWEKYNLIMSSISDVPAAFNSFTLIHKHRFIRAVFDNSLSYRDGAYRTPFLHTLFRYNELILNEKRLLFVEQPIKKIGDFLPSARDEIALPSGLRRSLKGGGYKSMNAVRFALLHCYFLRFARASPARSENNNAPPFWRGIHRFVHLRRILSNSFWGLLICLQLDSV